MSDITSSPVANFKLVCNKCDVANKKHSTQIYIDWEIRGYMLTCKDCDSTEFFNESGERINKEERALPEEKKKGLPN